MTKPIPPPPPLPLSLKRARVELRGTSRAYPSARDPNIWRYFREGFVSFKRIFLLSNRDSSLIIREIAHLDSLAWSILFLYLVYC